MQHTINSKSLMIIILILFFSFCSCKKFVEIEAPNNQVISTTVFSDEKTANSAVIGIYSQMMSSAQFFTNGGMSIFPGLSADEIFNTATNSTYDPFYKNSIPSNESSTNLNRFWTRGYTFIYQANAIIEGLENSVSIIDSVKNRLVGEAKFVRAFCYFNLINIYSDVPLLTSTDYRINAIAPRVVVLSVYEQIVSDILDAKRFLPIQYVTPSSFPTDRTRPNKYTAAAFLARVYLYLKNYASAESESSEVINSGIYSLLALNNVFLNNSNEAIWQLSPVGTSSNTAEGNIFIPATSASAKPTFAITNNLFNAFEVNDQRVLYWLKSKTVNGLTYYYPFKYKVKTGGAPYTEYNMVFRLAEQYLIRSEARAYQNNISGSKSDLNMVRNRAGLANTLANTQSDLLMAIEQERRVELFTEWGHRWLDLKRTNRADAVLAPIKGINWQPTDVLYPIPLSQIQANPYLVQNAGY